MRQDFHVSFKTEETISRFSDELRDIGGIGHLTDFSVTKFLETQILQKRAKNGKYILNNILKYTDRTGKNPAYVSYKPTILRIDQEIWNLAEIGEPTARYIVAHEIGHIMLHDHNAKAFSNEPGSIIKYAENEYSAEWQANTFAHHFLVPNRMVRTFRDAHSISQACNVTFKVAKHRLEAYLERERRFRLSYIGEACPECANFTLVRNGTCLKCDTCGSTTGCS